MKVWVEIVRLAGMKVVSRMGPMDQRRADKVERGALINLNREEYVVRQRRAKR